MPVGPHRIDVHRLAYHALQRVDESPRVEIAVEKSFPLLLAHPEERTALFLPPAAIVVGCLSAVYQCVDFLQLFFELPHLFVAYQPGIEFDAFEYPRTDKPFQLRFHLVQVVRVECQQIFIEILYDLSSLFGAVIMCLQIFFMIIYHLFPLQPVVALFR